MLTIDISDHMGQTYLYNPAELAIKITREIDKNPDKLVLMSREPVSLELNQFYMFLDDILLTCDFPKERIAIATSNLKEFSDRYHIMDYETRHGLCSNPNMLRNTKIPDWDQSKNFGMFIGRLSAMRLNSILKFNEFPYKDTGLVSWHQVPTDIGTDKLELFEFLSTTQYSWNDIKDLRPRSDIGDIVRPPIVPPHNIIGWENVYKKIGIEIVCETAEKDDALNITEKILRPMLYGRPFLIVGTRNYIHLIKNAKNIIGNPNIRFFENIIPINYDRTDGPNRVGHVFAMLHNLIKTRQLNTMLEKLAPDLEHNRNEAIRILTDKSRPPGPYERCYTKDEFYSWVNND